MDALVIVLICTNVGSLFVPMICADSDVGYQFVNPMVIYRNLRLNWFGVILATIGIHVVATIPAILYWFYKLCTVGRKD